MSSSEVSAIRVKLERELREKVDAYLDELSVEKYCSIMFIYLSIFFVAELMR